MLPHWASGLQTTPGPKGDNDVPPTVHGFHHGQGKISILSSLDSDGGLSTPTAPRSRKDAVNSTLSCSTTLKQGIASRLGSRYLHVQRDSLRGKAASIPP